MGFNIGQRVADYEIEGLVGAGGMGRVYRVRNVISQRTEAMKVLLADLQAEPELAARFVSEIRTLAALDHPNIAQLHTALRTEHELVMLMEFVEGSTLQQVAKENLIPPKKVLDYMQQVLAALSFAHARGVVHRDVKPANIMVTSYGVVKLTDFGIAKSKEKGEVTRPGTTMGSLHYMSPEQARGSSSVDHRSDLYSLGITMYELLAGRLPFDDESAYVLLQSQLSDAPRPPFEVNPLISKPLSDVILKALEKDPAHRWQDAASFSDALTQATGIVARLPMERAPVVAPAVRKGKGLIEVLHRGATTSRYLIASRGKFWLAAEAVAAAGLIAAVPVSLLHFNRDKAARYPVRATNPSFTASVVRPPAPAANNGAEAQSPMVVPPSLPAAQPEAGTRSPKAISHPAAPIGRTRAASSAARVSPAMDAEPAAEEETTPAPVSSASSAALIEKLREQQQKLELRAAAVRLNVQRLKTQREAEGDGLSQDVAGAYVRMNAYLSAERSDLQDGEIAAARDYLDRAASEVVLLEGMFSGSSPNPQSSDRH